MIDVSVYPEYVVAGFRDLADNDRDVEELLYRWDERTGIRQESGGDEDIDGMAAYKEVCDRWKEEHE